MIDKVYRELQFENDTVRVWKTVIPPQQKLEMHRHEGGRVIIPLKGGKLKKIEDTGKTSDLNFETHKAYWLAADPVNELHGDINLSPEPVELMVVELK
jgi:hypothetical protein